VNYVHPHISADSAIVEFKFIGNPRMASGTGFRMLTKGYLQWSYLMLLVLDLDFH
jgi:hypothetical protein